MDIATLRTKDVKELEVLLEEERGRLAALRFRLTARELRNVHEIRSTRRTIARILTILRPQQTIGAPSSAATP